jgi:hypothetical protein
MIARSAVCHAAAADGAKRSMLDDAIAAALPQLELAAGLALVRAWWRSDRRERVEPA